MLIHGNGARVQLCFYVATPEWYVGGSRRKCFCCRHLRLLIYYRNELQQLCSGESACVSFSLGILYYFLKHKLKKGKRNCQGSCGFPCIVENILCMYKKIKSKYWVSTSSTRRHVGVHVFTDHGQNQNIILLLCLFFLISQCFLNIFWKQKKEHSWYDRWWQMNNDMNELVFFLCVYAPISIWTDLGRKRTELRPDHRRPAIIPPVATRPRPRAKPPTTRPILTRRLLLVGFVIHTHHVSFFFSSPFCRQLWWWLKIA